MDDILARRRTRRATDEEVERDRLEALAELEPGIITGTQPGTFGFHEALHTACVQMEVFGEHVLEHPAIIRDPAFYLQAQRAFDELFQLYQDLGDAQEPPTP